MRRSWFGAFALASIALLAGKAWHDTMREPVVRQIELPFDLRGRDALRIVLLADIHVAGPDMPPERLERIVGQVNALRPDLLLIAGDFVSDKRTATQHYTVAEALAPLAGLRPDIIRLAVPGNHDHWRDVEAIEHELAQHSIGLLRNQVVNASGVIIGGLDDDFTGRADLEAVFQQVATFDGSALFLSHSPDPFADLPASSGIMLAGHTHCGQLAWPWGGSPSTMSEYGQRYACGVVRENGNVLVTSAGLGTSVLPIRLFTQPEIWVIDLVAIRDR